MRSKEPATSRLASQAASLAEAIRLVDGRLDEDLLESARRTANQVDARLAFSGNDTVIALAGATGSGKSSLFNAISGTRLAESGVKRPTTNTAMAGYWGDRLPEDLLDWLEVPRRHLVRGDLVALNGLTLIDMPDHDSTELSHRVEVDRLVGLVDMLIWVVDPQKYADAALHDNYLKPMASYADVMVIVLNQVDRLSDEQGRLAVKDLRRVLDAEGLAKSRIVTASALTGLGIAELRKLITDVVKKKSASARRFATTVHETARMIDQELGSVPVPAQLGEREIAQLNASLVSAAGVRSEERR